MQVLHAGLSISHMWDTSCGVCVCVCACYLLLLLLWLLWGRGLQLGLAPDWLLGVWGVVDCGGAVRVQEGLPCEEAAFSVCSYLWI